MESLLGSPTSTRAESNVLVGPWKAVTDPVVPRTSDTPLLARPWLVCAVDAALAAGGFALGYVLRYIWHLGGLHETLAPVPVTMLCLLGALAVALTLMELARTGAYRRRLSVTTMDAYLNSGFAVTVAMAVVIVAGASLQQGAVSRLAYAYAWLCMIALLYLGRGVRGTLLARSYRLGSGMKRVLVVGATPVGKMVMQNVAARRASGYQVIGYLGENDSTPQRFGRFPCLGTVAVLDRVLEKQGVDEVIVALPSASHAHVADIVARCESRKVGVKFVPDLFDLRLSRVQIDGVARIPLIDVRDAQPSILATLAKRTLDVVVASLALVAALPIMVATALAIKLESPGPILFRQQRLGKNGRPFTILKFRSMRSDAEQQLAALLASNEASGPIFKMRYDPRVTRVGRFIRTFSIDELPQLWNVLRGDMSLVGPRPPLASEVAQYSDWHRRRLEATPGITCLWGVSGRSQLDFDEMVMLDIYYIDNWSLGLDLHIILRTILTVLRPTGAY
ncbi:MAG TPA: sugar transferase [Chloroflexota bacterium]|nr:sugar transferase [Chloroflexota bacterium]